MQFTCAYFYIILHLLLQCTRCGPLWPCPKFRWELDEVHIQMHYSTAVQKLGPCSSVCTGMRFGVSPRATRVWWRAVCAHFCYFKLSSCGLMSKGVDHAVLRWTYVSCSLAKCVSAARHVFSVGVAFFFWICCAMRCVTAGCTYFLSTIVFV